MFLINGIKFTNIAEYIKKDNVDFNTVGEYQVQLKVSDSSKNTKTLPA